MPMTWTPTQDDELTNWLKQNRNNPLAPAPEQTAAMAPEQDIVPRETEDTVDGGDKIVDSRPGHSPDELSRYIQGQEAKVSQYGPEQEKMVMDKIAKDRRSFGEGVTRAGLTIGDSIMQGVAQAGNPGNLAAHDARKEREYEREAGNVGKLRNANMEQIGNIQKLEGMDSSTPLGKSTVEPLIAFFKSVGVPDNQIERMIRNPAAARSLVEPYAAMMGNQQKMQMEMLIKELELNSQNKRIEAETTSKQSQLDLDRDKAKREAASELLKRSGNARVWGMPIPFTSDVSGKEEDAAREVLMGQIDEKPEHGVPDLGSTFNGEKVVGVKRIK